MSKVFFNHIDHSEALVNFIKAKSDQDSGHWTISREGRKGFKVKFCINHEVFTETGRDPYALVSSIIHKAKFKGHRNKEAA